MIVHQPATQKNFGIGNMVKSSATFPFGNQFLCRLSYPPGAPC